MLRFLRWIAGLLFVSLCGCSTTTNAALKNATNSEIAVLYDSGFESSIKPGDTKKQNYNVRCIRVRSNGDIFEFSPPPLTEQLVRTGMLTSTVEAEFAEGGHLTIIALDGTAVPVKEGCADV